MIDNIFLETEDLFYSSTAMIHSLYSGKIPIWGYGVPCIDRVNPILPKSFHLVGAKTGGGKTRFIRHAMFFLPQRRVPTDEQDKLVYISVEDSADNFGLKAFEDFGAGVKEDRNFLKILEWAHHEKKEVCFEQIRDKLAETSDMHKNKNIAYRFWMNLEINELIATMNKYAGIFKIWCIDYLQGIKVHGKGVYDKNVCIATALRDAAIKNNIAIIGVVQLNRSADNVLTDRPPTMNDIEGAGAYEQAAHSILLLHREPKDMNGYFLPTDNINAYLFKNRLTGVVRKFKLTKDYEEIKDYGQNKEPESGPTIKDPWWTK